MTVDIIADQRIFGGRQLRFQHHSETLNCAMQGAIYLPPQAEHGPVPLLYWLSGLTCTDENFTQKAGAQRYAAEHGLAIVCPDTSPRGAGVPDDPEGAWDFGLGAGFYVNATAAPWNAHYRMYDYVALELPTLVAASFPVQAERCAVSGHSMGGHGALMLALRNPGRFASVSAFSPIVAPSQCPWGINAFSHYLGADQAQWQQYDSCALIRAGATAMPMLVDQGEADTFLESQLKTSLLEQACTDAGFQATIRLQPGYDHSYYFVSSFIGSHIAFHAEALAAG